MNGITEGTIESFKRTISYKVIEDKERMVYITTPEALKKIIEENKGKEFIMVPMAKTNISFVNLSGKTNEAVYATPEGLKR